MSGPSDYERGRRDALQSDAVQDMMEELVRYRDGDNKMVAAERTRLCAMTKDLPDNLALSAYLRAAGHPRKTCDALIAIVTDLRKDARRG